MASAVNPLRTAIATALEAATGKRAYHETETSRDTELPYYAIGVATEGKGSFYQQAGHAGTVQVKCWAEDSWAAQEMYDSLETTLDGVPLVIDGHRLLEPCVVTRFTEFSEPDPEVGGYCVIALIRTRTLVGA